MITRRNLLQTSGCLVCATGLTHVAQSTERPRVFDGCAISSDGYQSFRTQNEGIASFSDGMFARNRHWRTTGNPSIDRDLDRAIGVVADLLNVSPAFGFYDPAYLHNPQGIERDPWNAFATNEATDIPGTWGTVAFSVNLFRDEFYNRDPSGVSLMTIIAHEFGHILQYKYGHQLQVGYPRKSEVNADYWSGYFLGSRKKASPSLRFEKAGDMLLRFGSRNNNNQLRSHGDARERIDAAEAGFRAAYVENRTFEQAMLAGLEYVGAK